MVFSKHIIYHIAQIAIHGDVGNTILAVEFFKPDPVILEPEYAGLYDQGLGQIFRGQCNIPENQFPAVLQPVIISGQGIALLAFEAQISCNISG